MADYIGTSVGNYVILSDPDKIKDTIFFYRKNLSLKTQVFIDKQVLHYVDKVNRNYANWDKSKLILNKGITV